MYKKTHLEAHEMLHSLSMVAGIAGAFIYFGKWLGYPITGMFGDGSVLMLIAIWLVLASMHQSKK
jgi:hypothetical protein